MTAQTIVDVIVIGGGQAALATAYYLRRTSLSFLLLDDQKAPGGAWQNGWDSLRLFSPATWSSLSGWQMPETSDGCPCRDAVIEYLCNYEARYELPILRPVHVTSVTRDGAVFVVKSEDQQWRCRAVVSATGTWSKPFIPAYPNSELFSGPQLHSAHYKKPEPFAGKRVMIVGGGNSGAQILAEVSQVADTLWITPAPPAFLPDEVDGRVLFQRATERWKAQEEGREIKQPVGGLGDIVMVAPVREARERGVLVAQRPFQQFAAQGVGWADGHSEAVDAVIWCTGFRPALDHLHGLDVLEIDGTIAVDATRSRKQPGLWLVGYGEWTGAASATLIGVNRSARSTVNEIATTLQHSAEQ